MEIAEDSWLPEGFHFFGPEETALRKRLLYPITSLFEQNGFREVTLPSFDYASVFSSRLPSKEKKMILGVRDTFGGVLAPPADLTIQVAKSLAGDSTSDIAEKKVYYLGKRIKDHKRWNASRREVFQLGAEYIGDSSPSKVSFLIGLIHTALQNHITEGTIRLVFNHAGVLKFLCEKDPDLGRFFEKEKGLFLSKNLSELKKLAQNDSWSILVQTCRNFSEFKQLVQNRYGKESWWVSIRETLDPIEHLFNEIKEKYPKFSVLWDFNLLSELNYYTGTVFHAFACGFPEPIFSGGVYDSLIGSFGKSPIPACGFAIHIDQLEDYLARRAKGS